MTLVIIIQTYASLEAHLLPSPVSVQSLPRAPELIGTINLGVISVGFQIRGRGLPYTMASYTSARQLFLEEMFLDEFYLPPHVCCIQFRITCS